MIAWWRLGRELDRWAAAGRRPRLWWRDDDAGDVTLALERLVELASRHRLPLVLAVIPSGTGLPRLGAFLASRPGVFAAQHGVAHENRRRAGERDTEFRAEEQPGAIALPIATAWPAIGSLPRALKLYVPPWNDSHPALHEALRQAGFEGFSAGEPAALPGLGLRQAHAQVDLLRWKPSPRFRGRGATLARLRRMLRLRRLAGDWDGPIGLLTHHLAHDAAAWAFLDELLGRLSADPRFEWLDPARELSARRASAAAEGRRAA
ncbi:polysaccharide deacetylase family protein [Roseococcus pinisoli]|uniref:Polysaccharide deacetylase n=1 Tax=Roseococcus pinisoli TaxID=2835040 RepID=A0ABS5QIE5_9PROT|nr:hypothetical protein [Roseococcus pinisoli]MBS7813447.1 hypothetical protein [Roseococcus pinisoli]